MPRYEPKEGEKVIADTGNGTLVQGDTIKGPPVEPGTPNGNVLLTISHTEDGGELHFRLNDKINGLILGEIISALTHIRDAKFPVS